MGIDSMVFRDADFISGFIFQFLFDQIPKIWVLLKMHLLSKEGGEIGDR